MGLALAHGIVDGARFWQRADPQFAFQRDDTLFKLAQCGAPITSGGVKGDQTPVHLFGQLINGQGALGHCNRCGIGTALTMPVNQHGQCIEIAALPTLALLPHPRLELGAGRQRKAGEKRPAVELNRRAEGRWCAALYCLGQGSGKGHCIGLKLGRIKQHQVTLALHEIG